MNKIVYSFWTESLKHKWASYEELIDLDSVVEYSANCLYLSLLYAKKLGFEVEIFTDEESKHYFEKLPYDNLSTDLSFLSYHKTWVEGKMLAISKQTQPFVYLDWDVMLLKDKVAESIKNCQADILVQSIDVFNNENGFDGIETRMTISDLMEFQHFTDFSNFYISNFHRAHNSYCNTSVLGFNNLKVRDQYISNFKKCLSIVKKGNFENASVIIDEYLAYSTMKSMNASCASIITDNSKIQETAKNIGYTHLGHTSKFSSSTQAKIKDKIKKYFPKYKFLVEKETIKNDIKISLCTVVMNRLDHFVTTLKHNVKIIEKYKGIIDINVLDYNSTDGLEDYLFKQEWFVKAVKSKYVYYYKNFKARYYHRTLPKNKIHFLAKGAYLINIDADNFISKLYLDYCLNLIASEANFFLRPSINNTQGAFGRIMISKTDFKKIGGYNLKIENYGFEDSEITLRLRKLGIQQLVTPHNLKLDFIEHSNKLRIENEKPNFENSDQIFNIYKSDYDNRKSDLEK